MDILTNGSPVFTWVILPLLIFLARIMDQSIGTMRLIFVSKGMKHLAPFLGFFEVIIWLLAVGQIMQHLDNWLCYIAYGAGFAMGNFIGISIEERISLGTSIIRLILPSVSPELINMLKEQNFGLTIVEGKGSKGNVTIVFSIVRRKEVQNFIDTVNTFNPGTFYTIEDVRTVNEGIFRTVTTRSVFGSLSSRLMKAK
jgi:uncharacterized protein YebE (UPF0316 family)